MSGDHVRDDEKQTPGRQRPGVTARRTFLAGAGAAALAGLGAACTSDDGQASRTDDTPDPDPDKNAAAAAADRETGANGASAAKAPPVPFRADKQLGVLRPPTSAGLVATFDVVAADRSGLEAALQTLSAEIERIMDGAAAVDADEILPPPDSGIVDGAVGSGDTAITLAVGASLFDDRFGLADRRPRELIQMPRFFNDRLVSPELSDGDLALLISSNTPQGAVYALQQAVRVSGGDLRLRWVQEGYNDLLPPSAGSIAPTRNLMGFRDGTSNLDVENEDEMAEHVWVRQGDQEPEWAVGGTYLAVRTIRMLIEFWATAALVRQEQIFGRHRESGAPFGQTEEGEEPSFASDPGDQTVPIRSHIRLANPRSADTGRILRRGFSYLNGVDQTGALDQGLLFLAFQRSLARGFLAAQTRLDGEPMEDYIKPVGGGLFFVAPGPGGGGGGAGGGWLGQGLLT